MYVVEVSTKKRLAGLALRHRKGPFAPEVLYIFLWERRWV